MIVVLSDVFVLGDKPEPLVRGWVGASRFDGYASTVAGVFMGFLVGVILGALLASVASRR